jgi:hypothetical protein
LPRRIWFEIKCPVAVRSRATDNLVTRTTMRTCRAHYPGGSKRVHVSIASPSHAAFPELWAGRHPHCPFRGLLRLHSRYGRHACSTARHAEGVRCTTRPLSRGFDGAGCPATPPVSYQLNRQLAGWNPPPQVFRALEAHQRLRTFMSPLRVALVAQAGMAAVPFTADTCMPMRCAVQLGSDTQ